MAKIKVKMRTLELLPMFGHLRQESEDARHPYQEGALKKEMRHASTLLLGRLHASLNPITLAPE